MSEQDWVEKIIRNAVEQGKSNIAILQELDRQPFEYDVETVTRLINEWRQIKGGMNNAENN